jgi:hypothetical protein
MSAYAHGIFFAGVMFRTSLAFERASFELITRKERQQQLVKEKLMYVDFLCNKLKMPLQLTASAVESINSQVQDEQIVATSRKIMHSIMQVV